MLDSVMADETVMTFKACLKVVLETGYHFMDDVYELQRPRQLEIGQVLDHTIERLNAFCKELEYLLDPDAK